MMKHFVQRMRRYGLGSLAGVFVLIGASGCGSSHQYGEGRNYKIFWGFEGHSDVIRVKDPHRLTASKMAKVLESADLSLGTMGMIPVSDREVVTLAPTGRGTMEYPTRQGYGRGVWQRSEIQVNPEGMAIIRRQIVARRFQDWPLRTEAKGILDGSGIWVSVTSKEYEKDTFWRNACTSDVAGLFWDVEQVVLDPKYTTVLTTETFSWEEYLKRRKREMEQRTQKQSPATQPAATQTATQPSSDPK